ncbi:MAG: hypothetical protein V4546_06725 [Bacteroidota bacterium]
MRFWIIIHPKLSPNAMAIFPFILLRNKAQKRDFVLINHEKIHLRQQLELLIIPFYFLYGINYLLNLLKYKNHYQAYLNIVFEKEAYKFEKDPNYLSKRKWYNWINFYSA